MEPQPINTPSCTTARRLSRPEQAEHLTRWEQSGLSAKDYAREHSINFKSLYAWRRQLRLEQERSSDLPEASPFIPVRVRTLADSSDTGSLTVTLRAEALECVLSGVANSAELVSIVKSLKREVFDV